MSIPTAIEILKPWRALGVSDAGQAERLSNEFRSEVPLGHVLHGATVKAVAIRVDRDDVLFEVESALLPLAVVHLTWKRETDQRWPTTKFFATWDDWVRDEMLPAHQSYL